MRAESNSEGEAEASENGVENEATGVEEAEGEEEVSESEEAKPPRKPRVKLGDIMGVLFNFSFTALK